MSTSLIARYAILASGIFFAACSTRNTVTVTEKNFGDEIETRQNLVFTFNRDLAPDSVLNLWDSTTYMDFSPGVQGAFKWISGNQLVFSPSAEFKPSTAYTAKLNDQLLKFSPGSGEVDTEEKISFRTPYLESVSANSWWSLSEDEPGMVSLNLSVQFNYQIDPAAVARYLEVKINNRLTDVKLTSQEVANTLTIRTAGMSKDVLKGCTVTYTLKPGASCLSCGTPLAAPVTASLEVNAPDKLVITHVEGIPDNGTGTIRVYCNQDIIMKDILQLITLTPKVEFSVEAEGSGFRITGPFEPGGSYELMISRQLAGALGGAMEKDYSALVPFGDMEPSIGFVSGKGGYMSTLSSKKIGINIINIPKVKVRIFKIYENNIQAFMRYHRYNNYYDETDSYSFDYNDYNVQNLGDEIMSQEYEVKNLARHNGAHLLNLDFSAASRYNGIYLVTVASTEDRWIKTSKLVSISDIGLIVRKARDEIFVFANSIKSTSPVRGAKITFISTNNQEMVTAVTNESGVAVIRGLASRFAGFQAGMITARYENDFNYLSFNDTRVEDSRFDVGGKITNPSGYEAFIYGDREIYRPGETVYLNTIIRSTDMANLSKVPVKIRVLMPNGREYTNIRKTLNTQGAAEASFTLPSASVTGTWNMEVYSANDVLLNDRGFSVEEFIPDRISVNSVTDSEKYITGDSVRCDLTAMNLFGTPAAGRNYEMDFSLRKKTVHSKKFIGYNFNLSGADAVSFSNMLRQGKTSPEGKATEYFPLSTGYAYTGLLSGRIYVTVFDETGRPVNRVREFSVSTQKNYFGIRLNEFYNQTRQPVQIALAATDASGNPVNAPGANVQVIKVNWETIMERTYGTRYRYVSQKNEVVLVDKELDISSSGTNFTFTPNESGEYCIRIRDAEANTYVQSEFYAYGWGYTQNNSFEVNNEGRVEMEFDKETYAPGDKARILLKAPFAGKMLITVERDKVYDHFYVTTDKRSASIEIPVKEEYLPNVYVTATLIRPLDEGMIPVTIAHGFAPLKTEKKSNRLPVDIRVAAQSRSNTRQMITVSTIPSRDVEVTVAVIDEGIMQLKNSLTPDPYAWFYQKRALGVSAYDMYPYVLPDIKIRHSSTGGDGYDLQKRVNPLTNKRVKLVAYWSGILRTNGNGVATCTIDIPQFSGDLRVMAVAYKDKAFGSAEKHIKVADPIIISPSMPRFLSPGDTLSLPVTVTNTTQREQAVRVQLTHTGPLNVSGSALREVIIPPGGEQRPVFQLAAARGIGEGTVTIKVNNGSETFTDKTDITIRPAASLQKISGSGELNGGSSFDLVMTNNFIPGSRETKLILSRSPVVQFSDHLSYLLGYPHGCVEQTISTAFPQLYYVDLAKSISNRPGRAVKVSENIHAAIGKLQAMQQYNGAMSYWPGGNEESWWGSAYATHFLFEARKAGYEVPQATTNKLISYLGLMVKKHPKQHYRYYDASGTRVEKEIPSKDIFYSLYLMALYARADMATMNYYRSRMNDLALDSKYLLAASFLACGDRKTYTDLLPRMFEGEKSEKATGGNFHSFIRDEALALNALLETDPGNPQIGTMVLRLSRQMKSEKYLNTQERAFAFLALGKFMKQTSGTTVTARLTADGKPVGTFSGDDLTITSGISNGKVNLVTSGAGKLYYFWEMEGLTADGSFRREDNNLQVRKTFLNRFGKPVTSLSGFKQNELIVVKITLINTARNHVENIVVTDLLPAGFEIENPRVSAVPELSWIKDNSIPDHFDIRDDRINYFTSVSAETKYFYYLVRAVSTGKFVMGPVSADAMYDGSYHSYHGDGRVVVSP